MKELEDTITVENIVVHPYLTHINALLHSAVQTCKAAMKLENDFEVKKFKTDPIAANKNLEHQWSFKKTSKPPGRKKKGKIFRYVYKKKKSWLLYMTVYRKIGYNAAPQFFFFFTCTELLASRY